MWDNETVPGPDREGIPDNDDTARRESRLLAAGNLQEEEERGRFRRDERLRDVLSSGRVFLFKLLPYALVLVALIMGWHYFGPEKWAWLSAEQIDRIETALTGGVVSVIILLMRRDG